MTVEEDLLARERLLWTGGADMYRQHLADDALLVIPHEVFDKQRTIAEIDAAPRWEDVEVEDPRLLWLGDDSAVLVYQGTARREGMTYTALVSSTYVRHQGSWLLALHQQTPLPST